MTPEGRTPVDYTVYTCFYWECRRDIDPYNHVHVTEWIQGILRHFHGLCHFEYTSEAVQALAPAPEIYSVPEIQAA